MIHFYEAQSLLLGLALLILTYLVIHLLRPGSSQRDTPDHHDKH